MSGPCQPTYDRAVRLIRSLLAVLALSALLWSPAAFAKQYAPPGKAGTSEYAEDIPTAGGNAKTPGEGGGNKTSAQIDHLGAGKQGVRKLAKLGATGAAAAQFALQTAPTTTSAASSPSTVTNSSSTGTKTHGGHSQLAPERTLTASGSSAISALGRVIGGSDVGGIGIFLPLLLVAGALGAAALAAARTRRPRSGAPQP
jgi:hypothetical protein